MNPREAFDTDGKAEKDHFYRKSFALRLANVIRSQPQGESLVVSISSEWGAGKTNVLNWMRDVWAQETEPNDRAACIPIADFNPWGVTGERDLLFRLYEKLIKAIDPDDQLFSTWQNIKFHAAKHLGAGGKAVAGLVNAAEQKITGAAIEGATSLFETLCDVGIAEVRKSVEDRLIKSPWRLVVILDDIDRLEREELLILMRILKREAALPNTTFVLAMDEVQVSRIIGGEGTDAEQRGRKYLEKIVQARLQLPGIPPDVMKDFVLAHITNALGADSELDRERFDQIFDVLFLPRIKTPRTAKNLGNAIRFASGLLPGEVDQTDLVLLESARLLFPRLYWRIQEGDSHRGSSYLDLLLQRSGRSATQEEPSPYWLWCKQAWSDEDKKEATDSEKQALAAWLPQVNNPGNNGEEVEWWRAQRLCSSAYHWRYFTGAIVRGDISDKEVEQLRQLCLSNSKDAISKLIESLRDERGRVVAEKLCRAAYTEPEIRSMLLFLSTVEIEGFDSTEFASRISYSIAGTQTSKTLLLELAQTAPVRWVCAFFIKVGGRLMDMASQHKGGRPNKALKTLSERQLKELENNNESSVEAVVEDVWMVWHFGNTNKLKSVMSARLAANHKFAYAILACGCARGLSVPPPRMWNWKFEESVQSIARFIEIEEVEKALANEDRSLTTLHDEPSSPHRYCTPEELIHEFDSTIATRIYNSH